VSRSPLFLAPDSGELAQSLPRLTYKIAEAAKILGVSKMSVRRMVGAGEIKAVRRFRSPLIPAVELVRFVGKAR
jgi:excisionase family DNA binding protein